MQQTAKKNNNRKKNITQQIPEKKGWGCINLATWSSSSSLIKNPLGLVDNGYLPIKPRQEAEQDTASMPLGSALILFSAPRQR